MLKVCGTSLGVYGHTVYHQDMRRELSGGDRWKHFCAMVRIEKSPFFFEAFSGVLMPASRFGQCVTCSGFTLDFTSLLNYFLRNLCEGLRSSA